MDVTNIQNWWARRESNPRPIGYEPTALTPELRALVSALAVSIDSTKVTRCVVEYLGVDGWDVRSG